MKKTYKFYTDVYSFFILKKKLGKSTVEKIFSKIRVDNTFKTTSQNRMKDVNQTLKKHIKKISSKKLMLCDFGISSGQSTLELYKDLNQRKLVFVYSLNNQLLMVEYNKNCLRYRYFYLFKKIEKILIYLFNFFHVSYKDSQVLMPNLSQIKKFKFFEQDIFSVENKYFDFFDVVRVTNLLNYSYFSKSQIKIAILNLNKISKENSIVLINRTNNRKKNSASFFKKKNGKFELLEDMNGGSEIKELMLSC